MKILVPMLYRIAMPMLNRKNTGIRYDSMVSARTIQERTTAIRTQIATSDSARFLVSVTMADIPLKKHCLPASARMFSMASIVSSAEVVVSKIINIIVESSALKTSLMSSGNISIGMLISAKLSYQTTLLTCSTSSICSFNFATSLFSMPSQINIEQAPVPNSSTRIS